MAEQWNAAMWSKNKISQCQYNKVTKPCEAKRRDVSVIEK